MDMLSKLKALLTREKPGDSLMAFARERASLAQEGEALLGRVGWSCLKRYGRLMSGPYAGQYVSALPAADVRCLLGALQRGERIPAHLMHRHRSGCYEASFLSLSQGCLLMHYSDRTEPAGED